MSNQNTTPNFEALARELLQDVVTYASVTSLNFFKERFNAQGWEDGSFIAWPGRKSGDNGRAILVQTSSLRNSLRVLSKSPLRIEFGTSLPYAQIHNDGGVINIRVTRRSRKFFWYMFKATGEQRWKAMALTKKETMPLHVPQRKYIGESQTLMRSLDQWLDSEIKKRFETL